MELPYNFAIAEFFITRYHDQMVIDGREIAEKLLLGLKERNPRRRFLGIIFVGNDIASRRFVEQKKKIAEFLGVDFRIFNFECGIQEDDLKQEIRYVCEQDLCGGIVIQLPLPKHLDRQVILDIIPKEKDLDILSMGAYKVFLSGGSPTPPSVATFVEVLSRYQLLKNVSRETNLKFVVIGNGFLVGRPIFDYLRLRGKNVSVFDKGDAIQIQDADVVVLGVGTSHFINSNMVKVGALVVDFGCSFVDGKLCGDFNPINGNAIFYTPTPGGTGPILIAKLFENFYKLNGVD